MMRADKYAAKAPFEPDSVSKVYAAAEDKNFIQFYKEGDGQEVLATPQELKDHFIQLRSKSVLCKQTRTIWKMIAQDTGVHLLSDVLWNESGPYSLDNRATKQMLQCITNTYPTQSRLYQMGKLAARHAGSAVRVRQRHCITGSRSAESLQMPGRRSTMDIWSEVFPAICCHLPKGWQGFKETPIGGTRGDLLRH